MINYLVEISLEAKKSTSVLLVNKYLQVYKYLQYWYCNHTTVVSTSASEKSQVPLQVPLKDNINLY